MVAKTECPYCGKEATYDEQAQRWKCGNCEWVVTRNPMPTSEVLELVFGLYGNPDNDDNQTRDIVENVVGNWLLTHQVATHMKTKSIEQLIHYVVDRYGLTSNGKPDMERYLKLGDEIEKLIPILVE